MIRQIRMLSRDLVLDGQALRVVGVYMVRVGNTWQFDDADDTGYEGVACVDDVARAAMLFLEAGRRLELPAAIEEAGHYLRFLQYMQQPDGRFVNFILNWKGDKNLTGPTSLPQGANWNARALRAFALAAAVTGAAGFREAFDRSLAPVTGGRHYADVRALHVLAGLDLYEQTKEAHLRRLLTSWCDEIADLHDVRGRLLNWRDEYQPHLWGYVQAAALAPAAPARNRGDWRGVAGAPVLPGIAPLVRAAFPQRTTIPYEVSSVIADLTTLLQVTGDRRYRELLHLARCWFRGRNSGHHHVYDAIRGMVADGIDDSHLNSNSGAESNIEGGLALLGELPWTLYYSHPGPAVSHTRRVDIRHSQPTVAS